MKFPIKKIFIAGHRGMVGRSILKILDKDKYKIITATKKKLDLRNSNKVNYWFNKNKPDIVINAAGKVGGIISNYEDSINYLNDNISIGLNLTNASYKYNVKKFINIGSSCIYPKLSTQPIKEKYLLSGKLEETNKCYSLAKITTAILCEEYKLKKNKDFITVMPCNLYGPNDNYDNKSSHVLAALIKKIHRAKINNNSEIILFGNGLAKREFMYVDDLSYAIKKILNLKFRESIINVGSSEEVTILQLVKIISKILNYSVKVKFDKSKPNGTPRKILESRIIRKAGWKPKYNLQQGIKLSYEDFIKKNLK